MTPPHTYAEWSACIDAFARGGSDEEVIAAMRAGVLSWTGGVAPLFAQRISEVFSLRLQRIADEMTRALRHGSTGSDHVVLSRTLLDARRKLWVLNRVAQLPSLPGELAGSLQEQLRKYAAQAQQSLEDSARSERSGLLASIIRNNSLLRFDAEPIPASSGSVANPTNAAATSGGGVAQPAASTPAGGPAPRRRNILA
ncbi:hypothetical protein [Cupriavidus sp. UME77]|uniref:hypothetical protein n=1 Tax=Cupriavidus sp. UME77 TaxID=1862321 RepID=UPI001600D1D2|nr:hypothetical protein [Cupriavidus sp. UME77]MBB1634372.1 hypothetical protein [Cupriavidus sp. UME77]